DARASSVVVHVVADHAALHAQPDPSIHGETAAQPARDTSPPPAETRPAHDAGPAPTPETDANPETETVPAPAAPSTPRPAAVIPALRGTILPAALLAELIADGATVRVVADPDSLSTCAGYRPSTALAEFVRARDLTCRVPGCDRPAVHADLDHSNPWPGGPTHPGNTNCKCRLHHLLKTFWEGWTEQQLPDGTLRITTPTGHTYTTKPFSALLFPTWRTTTPPPPQSGQPAPPPSPGRALMMPTRRRTREQAKTAYITRERRLNALQRELDRAAAEQAAEQRRAKAAAEREAKPPRPSPD
ncbi:HNH endonuclease, partial [Mycobacterium sp. Y57]|nr:HNH endonuclease [Mycolicibacterium xanthum]